MAKVDILEGMGTMVIAKAPPWSRKKYCLKTLPRGSSIAQKKAQLALTKTAIGARGTKGQMGVAMEIQKKLAGKKHGGMSPSELRRRNYARAEATARRLETQTKG